jgi:hypothetical protein
MVDTPASKNYAMHSELSIPTSTMTVSKRYLKILRALADAFFVVE